MSKTNKQIFFEQEVWDWIQANGGGGIVNDMVKERIGIKITKTTDEVLNSKIFYGCEHCKAEFNEYQPGNPRFYCPECKKRVFSPLKYERLIK